MCGCRVVCAVVCADADAHQDLPGKKKYGEASHWKCKVQFVQIYVNAVHSNWLLFIAEHSVCVCFSLWWQNVSVCSSVCVCVLESGAVFVHSSGSSKHLPSAGYPLRKGQAEPLCTVDRSMANRSEAARMLLMPLMPQQHSPWNSKLQAIHFDAAQ